MAATEESSTQQNTQDHPRGRHADSPTEVPAKGWRDILLRVKDEMGKDNLSIISPGVAFLMLLAIFPGITAFVSIYGLIMDPVDVERQFSQLGSILPGDAREIITEQLHAVVSESDGSLGFGAVLGVLIALYSATKGAAAMVTGLNVAYDEEETRGFIKLKLITFLITLGTIVFGVLALIIVALLPAVLGSLGLSSATEIIVSILRWPLLVALVLGGLAILYHFGPCRDRPKWRWVTPGALAATILFIIGSALFSWYVSSYGSYNETYGSLGGAIILMMWLYLTAFIVLLGAELNTELEKQTKKDTTVGEPEPMGERGAYAADNKGRVPE